MDQALGEALQPVVSPVRAAANLRTDLIREAKALLGDRRRHRWALRDFVHEPPQRVADQQAVDESFEQAAVEEAVNQPLGALAFEHLLDGALKAGTGKETLQFAAVQDPIDSPPLEIHTGSGGSPQRSGEGSYGRGRRTTSDRRKIVQHARSRIVAWFLDHFALTRSSQEPVGMQSPESGDADPPTSARLRVALSPFSGDVRLGGLPHDAGVRVQARDRR